MGVTISCTKTGRTIDMGSGGFLRLRSKISELVGEPWTSHYKALVEERICDEKERESGDEPPKRKLWARLGVSIYITAEEEATIFGGNEETTARTIRKIIAEGRFVPDGDSYVPEQTVEQFNNDYGTSYPIQDINFDV